jgi:hypothetical protein
MLSSQDDFGWQGLFSFFRHVVRNVILN